MATVKIKADFSLDDLTILLESLGRDLYPIYERRQHTDEELKEKDKLYNRLLDKAITLDARLKKESELDQIEEEMPELEATPG